MKSQSVPREAWLAAIREAMPEPVVDDSALTVEEFRKLANCSQKTAWKMLEAWEQSGRAERCVKLTTRIDGQSMRTTAFRLLNGGSGCGAASR